MKKIIIVVTVLACFFITACSAADMMGESETNVHGSLTFDRGTLRYEARHDHDLFYDVGRPSADVPVYLDMNDVEQSDDERLATRHLLNMLETLREDTGLSMGTLLGLSSAALKDRLDEHALTYSLVDIITFNDLKSVMATLSAEEGTRDTIRKIAYYERRTGTSLSEDDIHALDLLQSTMNQAENLDIPLTSETTDPSDAESIAGIIDEHDFYYGGAATPDEATLERALTLMAALKTDDDA